MSISISNYPSQLSKNREILMDKIKHTVVHSVTSFSDMRAGILKEIREEKGQYDYTDVVNACGLSYARLYSEIEQRYENEQYYKVDGTPLTKEDEIEWLDIQFEQEVAWQKSCARITAQGQVIQGNIPEMPTRGDGRIGRQLLSSEGCLYEAVPGKQAGGEAACFAKLYIWQWPDV